MKKKLVLVILIIFLFIDICVVGVFVARKLIRNYRNDRSRTLEIISKVDSEYKDFESNITDYNKSLKQLVSLINESSYYAEFNKNNKEMIALLDKVSEQVKKMSEYKTLNNNCDITYADGKTNRACASYIKTYEKSVNVYIDVVKAYNNIITKLKEVYTGTEINEYTAVFNDYIDCNNDGTFLGKEEIKKEKEVQQNGKEEKEEK